MSFLTSDPVSLDTDIVAYPNIEHKTIPALARTYNILDYEINLKSMLNHVLNAESDLHCLSKYKTHKLINNILLEYYQGENTLKAKLVEMFVSQNIVAAFELRVNKSRVDFLSINGESKSFEIKSKLDNLRKLKKQAGDYEKAFDYNFIVINEEHYKSAVELIPDHYGIFILNDQNLLEVKQSFLNTNLDPVIQLHLLTKKDRVKYFKSESGDTDTILKDYTSAEINELFKQALKARYRNKWNFLVKHSQEIFPIDYQFFFNHNIEPKLIYNV